VIAGVRVVVRALEGWDAAGLKAMATSLAAAGGAAAVLLTASLPAQAVVARSIDVRIDARAILRQLVDRFGGKGGGKPDLAQGGGLTGDLRQMVWEASGLVEEAIQPRRNEDREDHES
jgi:alanyl-tRNA synthetase